MGRDVEVGESAGAWFVAGLSGDGDAVAGVSSGERIGDSTVTPPPVHDEIHNKVNESKRRVS